MSQTFSVDDDPIGLPMLTIVKNAPGKPEAA